MKIVIDLTSLADNFTGIERFASSITYEMLKKHPENEYVLFFKREIFPQFEEFKEQRNVTCKVLREHKKIIFLQFILLNEVRKVKADYYLFLAFPTPIFLFKKNMITTIHDIGCWDCPEAMEWFSKLYFRLSYRKDVLFDKHIFTVSDFSKNRICEKLKVNPSKVSVIFNGISEVFTDYIPNEEKKQQVLLRYGLPENYLLCLSTLEPRKNMRLLIDAYESLILEGKIDVELVLAGRKGWKIDNLLENIHPNVVPRIHFTGFVENDDLPVIYKCARCFVFPSKYEGFGIPPLEALAMGTEVISSDAASMPEILGDEVMYFCNGDKESLKKSLLQVLNQVKDKEEDDAMTRRIIQKYSWENEADRLIEELRNLE